MGVKGLFWFIVDHPQFGLLKPYKLHDSFVIIDGDNLIYSLYFGYKVNVVCGGDYNKYAEHIREYISPFLQCNIKPIVVCDGGHDISDRKMKTIFKNNYEKLENVLYIAEKKRHRCVLPFLSHDVFINVLKDLNVPLVMCDFEADDQIAALANHYKCPVISEDSDFFIFDVHNGFIPRDSIELDVILDTDSSGREYRYLDCKRYCIDEFVSCFPGIEKTVLPLFASLMGNDYVERAEFDNFFATMQLQTDETITSLFKDFHVPTISLLKWLKGKSVSDAIGQVLEYLDKERQEHVKSLLEMSVASYDCQACSLRHIVDQKLNCVKCEFLLDSGLTTPCGNPLPLDFLVKYHSGHFSSFFPDIIVAHRCFLSPQINDFSFCSSHMCARYIRRVIYGILTCHDVEGCPCQNDKCLAPIEEYDRHETRFDTELVEPIFIVESFGTLPKLNELSNLKKETAMLIINKVLGLKSSFVKDIPDEWQLFLGSIHYCLCYSVPCFTEAFLYAVIISLIYWDIIAHKNPYQNASIYCKNCTNGNNVCTSIACTLQKINQSDLLHAAENLKTYLSQPYIDRRNHLYVKIVHSYSQLQTSLSTAVFLNKLLDTCYKNPDIHKYLDGSMLYNLANDIFTWPDPTSFVAGVLGRKTTLFKLFTLLDSKVRHGVPYNYILKNATFYRKKFRVFW